MPDPGLIALWLASILGAYVILFWAAAWWARRTPNDIDDVIVGVLQRPVVIGLFLWAMSDLARRITYDVPIKHAVANGAGFLLIGVITWGVWRLVRDTMLYYGRRLAKRTESNFDDVLIPVLDVLAPVVILGTGAILMLRLLGADLSTVVLTAGGAALFLGLTLGDSLRNIFGGLLLLVDTPFRFGDLVVWDNVVCQIKHIGLRVTTLYNTEDHSEIFLPNSLLAASKLTNLTRPSPDLRMPIELAIADGTQVTAAKALLHEVADANPYVLGALPAKIAAIRRALAGMDRTTPRARELRWGLAALRREQDVDRCLKQIVALLDSLLVTIRGAESGGMMENELSTIAQRLFELEQQDDCLRAAMRRWADTRARDPNLRRYPQDRERLLADADSRLLAYESRLDALHALLKRPDLYEAQRIDDEVAELRNWLPLMFKLITPAWKYPFVSVVQAGPGGASLRLIVYVDDIHLEGFVRRQRVITALREAAAARLQALRC